MSLLDRRYALIRHSLESPTVATDCTALGVEPCHHMGTADGRGCGPRICVGADGRQCHVEPRRT